MYRPEIILIGGAPGSGKSSIAKTYVENRDGEGVRHLSVGDLKRSIVAGETPSVFADALRDKERWNRKTGAAPSWAMIGMIEEFIKAEPEGLTILDGFPRYKDRLLPFSASMSRIGGRVLAVCRVEVSHETLLERLGGREGREHQKLTDPNERLADHYDNIVPTLDALALDYPTYTLDGTLPLDKNAAELDDIYRAHSVAG